MKFRFPVSVLLAVSAMQASATTVVYNSESAFLGAIRPDYYLENFSDWTNGAPEDGSNTSYESQTVNGYKWRATANEGIYSLGPTAYNLPGISTWVASDQVTFTFVGKAVTAFGGIFSAQDAFGNPVNQTVVVTLSDGTVATLSGSGFVAFASTEHIQSVVINVASGSLCGSLGVDCNYSESSHLYTATAKDVPEPATPVLLGAGLSAFFAGRRKRWC